MATHIPFTDNYDDLSTDQGFQFTFRCERCGNGYMSSFQANLGGMAQGALRAAGNMFGGLLGRAADSAYEIQRAVGGPAHDAALKTVIRKGVDCRASKPAKGPPRGQEEGGGRA